MSSLNSWIPRTGAIEVADPPALSAVGFVKQVIENISELIDPIDLELHKATAGDAAFVKALFESIHEIKSRAEQASMILTQITSDPPTLEASIARVDPPAATLHSTLKLIEAVHELEKELRDGEYDYFRVVADLLSDVQDQLAHFRSFVATPHVGMIVKKVQAIESELRRQVQWCFREIGALLPSDKYVQDVDIASVECMVEVSCLRDVSQVIDILGDKFRCDLLERFAQLQLIPYEKLFKAGTRFAGLEHLDQRYAWFRYLLHVVDDKLGEVFPSKYQIGYHLFLEFQRRTRNHLGEVLAQEEREYSPNADVTARVGTLIKGIKSVMAFEVEVLSTMNIDVGGGQHGDGAATRPSDGDNGGAAPAAPAPLSIRDAFDPYLGAYVQLEKKGLEDLMAQVMRDEEATLTAAAPPPPAAGAAPSAGAGAAGSAVTTDRFESANKLFEYIKGSLKRCVAFSTGITFLSLSKEFRLALQQYAEALKCRCPAPQRPARGKEPAFYGLNRASEATMCRVLATCEACIDILPSLENLMRAKIQPNLTDQIDFNPQVDSFMDTMSFTMNVLAIGEVERMEDDYNKMRAINWGSVEDVGESGPHVKHMLRILTDCVPRIRKHMSASYFLNMCMKLVAVFADSFLAAIYSLRKINPTGGGQLLLDLNTVKEFLVSMPNTRTPVDQSKIDISKVYLSVVNSKLKKVENHLKLVCVADDQLKDTFAALWPDATEDDFNAINALRGNRNIMSDIKYAVAPLDNMGEVLRDQAKNVHKNTVQGVNKTMAKVTGGVKSVFGDIMAGNLFADSSTHSNEHSGHGGGASGHGGNGHNLKGAVSGVTAGMAFKKAAAAPGSAPKK